MPAPTNITPGTATVITVLPYTVTLDVSAAPTGAGYPPTLGGFETQAVWWTYTPPAGTKALGITFSYDIATYPDYNPVLSIWMGSPLAQIPEQAFIVSTAQVGRVAVDVTPGEPVYIQVDQGDAVAHPGAITLTVEAYPNVDAPAGSLMVPNDLPFFPNVLISRTDGSLLQFDNLPSCEMGEWLPDGTLAIIAETDTGAGLELDTVKIYNSQLVYQRSIAGLLDPTARVTSPITSNGSNRFYLCETIGSTTAMVRAFLGDGTTGATWDISGTHRQPGAIAVSPDESILYVSRPKLNVPAQTLALGRWDLVGNLPMSNLVTPIPGTYFQVGRDLICLSDGSLLWVVYGTVNWTVLHYSAAGALLNTYNMGTVVRQPRIRLDPTDPTTFWAMDWTGSGATGDSVTLRQVRISDGTVLTTVTNTIKEPPSSAAPLWGVSQSCPLLMNPLAIAAVVPPPPAPTTNPGCVVPLPPSAQW